MTTGRGSLRELYLRELFGDELQACLNAPEQHGHSWLRVEAGHAGDDVADALNVLLKVGRDVLEASK